MARRRTIGENPLDALLAPPVKPAAPRKATPGGAKRPRTGTAPSASTPAAPGRSVRATFHLPAALVDEAKNAVVALSGPPLRLTLASLVRDAVRRELDRLKKEQHAGRPFPARSAPLVGGRPLKT